MVCGIGQPTKPFVEDLDINCFTGLGVPHPFLVDVDPYQRVEVIFVTR